MFKFSKNKEEKTFSQYLEEMGFKKKLLFINISSAFKNLLPAQKMSIINLLVTIADCDKKQKSQETEVDMLNTFIQMLSITRSNCTDYFITGGEQKIIDDLELLSSYQKELLLFAVLELIICDGDANETEVNTTFQLFDHIRIDGRIFENTIDELLADNPTKMKLFGVFLNSQDSTRLKPLITNRGISSFDMIYIKGGTFQMGRSIIPLEDEEPVHKVTVNNFYMSRNLVTQLDWKIIMADNPSTYKGNYKPVEHVSWDDVQDFINKLNLKTNKEYRLPTEAEWEYVAKGGDRQWSTDTPFTLSNYSALGGHRYFGHTYDEISGLVFEANPGNRPTHMVGSSSPNNLGLYDICGNVWEWCNDWYGKYGNEDQNNPTSPSIGTDRVLRSVPMYNLSNYCRVEGRRGFKSNINKYITGFRLVHSE